MFSSILGGTARCISGVCVPGTTPG
jgi:hypothetical protein